MSKSQAGLKSWTPETAGDFEEFDGVSKGFVGTLPDCPVYATDMRDIRECIRLRARAMGRLDLVDMGDEELEQEVRDDESLFFLPKSFEWETRVDEVRGVLAYEFGFVRPANYPLFLELEVVCPTDEDCVAWALPEQDYDMSKCLMLFAEALDFKCRTSDGVELGIAPDPRVIAKATVIMRERNALEETGLHWTLRRYDPETDGEAEGYKERFEAARQKATQTAYSVFIADTLDALLQVMRKCVRPKQK